jgi:ankyrin repeat protein/Tfp pilus assembly protein PilF
MERHKYNEMSKLVIAVFDKYGHEDALNRLNSGIAKKPHLVEAYLVRGELCMELNDFQMALNDFEKAIMINPNEPEAYFLRGLLYVNKGDIDKAINDFDKTIELDANHADAYINRANIYLKKKLLQKASIDCTKAIELSPDRIEPYYYRGLSYSEFGGYTKALEDYNMAIGIADESSDQHTDTLAKRRIAKSRPSIVLEAMRNAELIHSMLEEAENSKTTGKNTHNIAKISSTKYTDIFDAIRNGALEDVMYFIEQKKVDVNTKNIDGVSLLHMAAGHGMAEIAEVLISNGANVNAKMDNGFTPLFVAINVGVAKVLISAGADINAKNSVGSTPLFGAARIGMAEIAEVLISNGANVSAKMDEGFTPLFVASNADVAKVLISAGADINAKTPVGFTPLHFASNVDVAKFFISAGADINAKTFSSGTTPVTEARNSGRTEVAQYLSSINRYDYDYDYVIKSNVRL